MLERCKMDGTEREPIVTNKIVYPYGVVVDYPVKHVYWVDTYLDYVERVDYDGQNRKNIMKGVRVQNLYGISIFESKLFVSSWHNNSILEIHKFQQQQKTVLGNISRPFNLHVFHRQRQPDVAHPCRTTNECQHLCVPIWNRDIAVKKCMCAAGYHLNEKNECVTKMVSKFLLLAQGKPTAVKGITLEGASEELLVTNITEPYSVDYDSKKNLVVYSDLGRKVIESVLLSNISKRTVLQSKVYSDGVAVDWIGQNLYFIEGKNDIFVFVDFVF